jgi:hypothetical protein
MIQSEGFDGQRASLKCLSALDLPKINIRADFREGHREKRFGHQDTKQPSYLIGWPVCIKDDFHTRLEQGSKRWQALDVVPVEVCQENVYAGPGAPHQLHAWRTNTAAAVDEDCLLFAGIADLQASCVAAVP